MIAARTVLILGAGASKPYGFPLGVELTASILEGLGSDERNGLSRMLRACGFDSEEIDRFRNRLSALGTKTVDRFLEHQPEFLKIGRTAIAATLVPCEDGPAGWANSPW